MNSADWEHTTIGQVIDFYTAGTPFRKLEYVEDGVPVLAKGDVKPFGVLNTAVDRYADPSVADKPGYRLTKPGDLILTTRDLTLAADFLGLVAPVPCDRRFLVNQGANVIRLNDMVNMRYFVYWCNGPMYREHIKASAIGSTQIHLRKGDFLEAPIFLPPLDEQDAIAEVLGALDDKIELNRKMNATLDELARTIFRSWFVDFDPVRAKMEGRVPFGMDAATAALFPDRLVDSPLGPIPEGWGVRRVDDVADINRSSIKARDEWDSIQYVDISSTREGDISETTRYAKGEEPSRAGRRLQHGDTALSTVRPNRRSYFLVLHPPGDMIASTGFAVATPVSVPWSFLHSGLTLDSVFETLGNLADGGAYPAVRPNVIGELKLVIPHDKELIEAYDRAAKPLYELAASNRTESRKLAELRDTLLPELLSGRIRVPDAEKLASEVV